MFERLLEWFSDFDWRRWMGIYHMRRGRRLVKRLYNWIPIICNDEDWDSHFLFIIMRHKIGRMRKSIELANRHTTADRDVRDMRIMEHMLARQIKDDDLPAVPDDLCTCMMAMKDGLVLNHDRPSFDENGKYQSPFCNYCRKYGLKRRRKVREEQFSYMMSHFTKNVRRWWD